MLWAAAWAPLPSAGLGLFRTSGPRRGPQQTGGIQERHQEMPQYTCRSACNISISDSQKHLAAPESCARLVSPNTAVLSSLLPIMPIFNLISVLQHTMLPGYISDCIPVFSLQYFTSFALTITESARDLQPRWYRLSSLLNPSLRFPLFPPSSANCIVFIFRYAGNLIMKERFFFFLFLISTW